LKPFILDVVSDYNGPRERRFGGYRKALFAPKTPVAVQPIGIYGNICNLFLGEFNTHHDHPATYFNIIT